MKKFILITTVMFFTMLQAKAQQENQTIGATSITLPAGNTLIKDNQSFEFSNDPENDGTVKDHAYYMRKKMNNLNAGLVTLSAGVLLSGLGVIIGSNISAFDDATVPAVLLITGAASGIASIPLMIMATVYGHKAKLELSKQKTGFGAPSKVSKNITGITMTIPIGK